MRQVKSKALQGQKVFLHGLSDDDRSSIRTKLMGLGARVQGRFIGESRYGISPQTTFHVIAQEKASLPVVILNIFCDITRIPFKKEVMK